MAWDDTIYIKKTPFNVTEWAAYPDLINNSVRMSNVAINTMSNLIAQMPVTGDDTKASFDSAKNGLVYLIGFTPTVSDYANIVNMPVRASGTLITLSRSASYDVGAVQVYIATGNRMFIRTKLASTWRNWTEDQLVPSDGALQVPTVYHVGPTRTYTSLVALLKDIQTDTSRKIIYMDPGKYNIYQEYLDNNIPTPPSGTATDQYFDYNVFLPQNTDLIGLGCVTLTFNMPSNADELTSKMWAPLNLWYGNNRVENIRIECKNCRYAIHDDSHNTYTGFTNRYINVELIKEANDGTLGMLPVTGFGFSDGSRFIFENCRFVSNAAGNVSALYGHDGKNGGSSIEVNNCYMAAASSSTNTLRFQTIRPQSNLNPDAPIRVKINQTKIVGGIMLQQYTGGGQFFDVTLVRSGNPTQTIDIDPNPYPIHVYE